MERIFQDIGEKIELYIHILKPEAEKKKHWVTRSIVGNRNQTDKKIETFDAWMRRSHSIQYRDSESVKKLNPFNYAKTIKFESLD